MRTIVFFTRPSSGKFSDENKKISHSACFRHVISTKERCFTTSAEPKSKFEVIKLSTLDFTMGFKGIFANFRQLLRFTGP